MGVVAWIENTDQSNDWLCLSLHFVKHPISNRDDYEWPVFVATVLNRSVTLKLQRGERSISAEQYDSATVYFSDVSDFAELSASYNPMQIVAILNEIYKYVCVKLWICMWGLSVGLFVFWEFAILLRGNL